ncbi:hypothetical protein b3_0278 [Synechococcus phage B3]|jgi:hypothetical protein|nr:hypothetical protein b3_0278 [Synechococcus phage B3]QGT54885.1 hypothetical protein b23_0271 [Synechococcus phage B23]
MEELINSIITDESPSAISDSIKDILTAKVMSKIDEYRPEVAVSMFNTPSE